MSNEKQAYHLVLKLGFTFLYFWLPLTRLMVELDFVSESDAYEFLERKLQKTTKLEWHEVLGGK